MIDVVTAPTHEGSVPEVHDGVFVARAHIPDWGVEPRSHRALVQLLDCDYPRWHDSRSEDFRTRFVATRHFAKAMVARVTDTSIDDVEISRCTRGRPEFGIRHGTHRHVVDANLSHTRDTVVVAVSTRGRVGVDVEALDRDLDRADFARAVCHRDELSEYEQRTPAERKRMLLDLWTWKEAATKAMGTGLATPFPSLRADVTRATVSGDTGATWRIHALAGGGYGVAVASEAA